MLPCCVAVFGLDLVALVVSFIFYTFCIFWFLQFFSVVLLCYGSQFNGFWPFW